MVKHRFCWLCSTTLVMFVTPILRTIHFAFSGSARLGQMGTFGYFAILPYIVGFGVLKNPEKKVGIT